MNEYQKRSLSYTGAVIPPYEDLLMRIAANAIRAIENEEYLTDMVAVYNLLDYYMLEREEEHLSDYLLEVPDDCYTEDDVVFQEGEPLNKEFAYILKLFAKFIDVYVNGNSSDISTVIRQLLKILQKTGDNHGNNNQDR